LFGPGGDPCKSLMGTGLVVNHDRDSVLRSDVSTQCGYWPTIGGEWAIRSTELSMAADGLGVKRLRIFSLLRCRCAPLRKRVGDCMSQSYRGHGVGGAQAAYRRQASGRLNFYSQYQRPIVPSRIQPCLFLHAVRTTPPSGVLLRPYSVLIHPKLYVGFNEFRHHACRSLSSDDS
jgi:hypothetical protein